MKRIFITGGTGFFGKSMLDYRRRNPAWEWSNAEWTILSRDPSAFAARFPELSSLPGVSFTTGDVRDFSFPKKRFDAIMHAAGETSADPLDDATREDIEAGASHVASFARASGCAKVLFTSSGAVYGPRTSMAAEDDACAPSTQYGKGKLAAERIFLESGLDVNIARCFAFTGPYLERRGRYAMGNFIQDCLERREIRLKGDGTPLRSYMFADDLVEWLFEMLKRGERGETYNVGSSCAISIASLARMVESTLGGRRQSEERDDCPEAGSARGGDHEVYVPDTAKAETRLGLTCRVPLERAILLSAQNPR